MRKSSSRGRSDDVVVSEDGTELLEGEPLGLLEEEVGDDRVEDVGDDKDEEVLVAELLETDGGDLREEDVHGPVGAGRDGGTHGSEGHAWEEEEEGGEERVAGQSLSRLCAVLPCNHSSGEKQLTEDLGLVDPRDGSVRPREDESEHEDGGDSGDTGRVGSLLSVGEHGSASSLPGKHDGHEDSSVDEGLASADSIDDEGDEGKGLDDSGGSVDSRDEQHSRARKSESLVDRGSEVRVDCRWEIERRRVSSGVGVGRGSEGVGTDR